MARCKDTVAINNFRKLGDCPQVSPKKESPPRQAVLVRLGGSRQADFCLLVLILLEIQIGAMVVE